MSAIALPPGGGRGFGPAHAKVEFGESEDFAVFESVLPPDWAGPPPHLHRAYDEAFYVVDGSVAFTLDGGTATCPAGSFVFVPRGAAHGFANPAPAPATILVIASPGAIRLVESIYQVAEQADPPDPDAMAALYAEHRSEILPPAAARARP
ncbi:cupin domain-containing protein [Pseudonocardia broussonetiae]|uniref:Cupin domain-containing protein n=1 Tax=Pseudonocardia broussonetiae TaxID=2736640 RepID=A0A6M6JI48_9PSEU|nr:cupin domain-containing protein [Pseudonocardia broussonetiae]QJY46392.1 cupin domain-containing protein [Pseudonocardia broussonetiae]